MKKTIVYAIPVVLLTACSHNKTTEPPLASAVSAPTAAEVVAPSGATPASAAVLAACNIDLDCPRSQLCANSFCVDITSTLPECNNLRVHFDFDRASIRSEDEPVIARTARCILAEKGTKVVITGNADERGTEEYNLALGERRAQRVAEALSHQGVSPEQLRTVSYGKNQPLCSEHTEACWSENRRSAVNQEGGAISSR